MAVGSVNLEQQGGTKMFITFLYISLCVTVSVIHGDESSTTALPRQRISPTPTGTTEKYTTVASSTINNLDEQNITFALSARYSFSCLYLEWESVVIAMFYIPQ